MSNPYPEPLFYIETYVLQEKIIIFDFWRRSPEPILTPGLGIQAVGQERGPRSPKVNQMDGHQSRGTAAMLDYRSSCLRAAEVEIKECPTCSSVICPQVAILTRTWPFDGCLDGTVDWAAVWDW